MPFIFSTNYFYRDKNYQIDIDDAINRFPFITDKTILGEILAVYIENKAKPVREPLEFTITQDQQKPNRLTGIIGNLNPLKKGGIPPCQVCIVLYKYRDQSGEAINEFPIMEGEIIKGNTWSNFDDIIKKALKEQEISMMLESTTFHPELAQLPQLLRDSQVSFEDERYPDAKTSCRKILENLRNKSKNWDTIDGSKSACEKLNKVMDSMYSFASFGGPHEGLNTEDETEVILKSTSSIFFYINKLIKANRISLKAEGNS